MDIDEPVKTACGQTLREATGTITLHISASLSADNVSYDLASVDADLPITVEVVNNNGTIMPKVDSVGLHTNPHRRNQRIHQRHQSLTTGRGGKIPKPAATGTLPAWPLFLSLRKFSDIRTGVARARRLRMYCTCIAR